MKLTIIKLEKLDDSIVANTKAAEKVRDTIHRQAASVLYWWFKGDLKADEAVDYMNRIADTSDFYTKRFNTWLSVKTPFQWSDETKKFYAHTGQKLKEETFVDARDNPFWKVAAAPDPKPLDLFDGIDRLIKQAEKHLEKPVDDDVIDLETVRLLRDVAKRRDAVAAKAAAASA